LWQLEGVDFCNRGLDVDYFNGPVLRIPANLLTALCLGSALRNSAGVLRIAAVPAVICGASD
jgi:hypothetical protein